MAITLERIVDKAIDQAPLLIGIGVVGYVAWQILQQQQGKGPSRARVGKVGD